MYRQDIINMLDAFPYDRSEYWVITGGAMVLYGFRKETGDIDLGCTKAMADLLEADGFLYKIQNNGMRWFKYEEDIEIFEDWLEDTVQTVDGIPVISVKGLIEMKKDLGREKDLRDIALIEEHIKKEEGMTKERADALRKEWEAEEEIAHIHGWDFSHIHGKYSEEDDLPWDYEQIVNEYRNPDMKMLDFDTGGGEFLLSLNHPYENTAATEGYPPNVELCKEVLLPLGIDFRECADESNIPFDDESFDLFINRHGSFDPVECCRLLRPGGLFITEQVGSENDRDLVKLVLPDLPKPFSDLKLDIQRKKFEEAGFEILRAEEAFRPIIFYDIGAFVWFAHIIEWEFTGFSVEKCFDRLLALQEEIDRNGKIEGTIHRYLIVAKKR